MRYFERRLVDLQERWPGWKPLGLVNDPRFLVGATFAGPGEVRNEEKEQVDWEDELRTLCQQVKPRKDIGKGTRPKFSWPERFRILDLWDLVRPTGFGQENFLDKVYEYSDVEVKADNLREWREKRKAQQALPTQATETASSPPVPR
jgi:hypothetical protein